MRIDNLYKHENGSDAAILILKHPLFIAPKNGYKIRIKWMNIVNPKNVYDIGIMETIFIKKEDIKNWKFYEENK